MCKKCGGEQSVPRGVIPVIDRGGIVRVQVSCGTCTPGYVGWQLRWVTDGPNPACAGVCCARCAGRLRWASQSDLALLGRMSDDDEITERLVTAPWLCWWCGIATDHGIRLMDRKALKEMRKAHGLEVKINQSHLVDASLTNMSALLRASDRRAKLSAKRDELGRRLVVLPHETVPVARDEA